jgi:3-phenylpropionate/trans-cinnamate dioxygenase ferredoxin subunit
MGDFKRIADTHEIPLGEMRSFDLGLYNVVIVHTDDGYFAIRDECTHDSAAISDGELDDGEVVCARHGARFDLATGAVKAPPALAPLDTYELKIDGEDILVRIDD